MGNAGSSIEDLVMYGDLLELKKQLEKHQTTENNQQQEEYVEELNHGLLTAASVRDRPLQQLQCVLELLLDAGAEVNSIDAQGWTCLHHAVVAENLSLIPFLLKHHARAVRDIHGLLPQDLLGSESESSAQPIDVIRAQLSDMTESSDGFSLCFGNNRKHSDELNGKSWEHEYGTPVVLKYSSPEDSPLKAGYIQLLYHLPDQSFSSEPIYGNHMQLVKGSHRGVIQFDTADLPEYAACHFVYIACDPSMMRRKVVASTHALWLKQGISKFTLKVAGVLFHHSSRELDGCEFESSEDLKKYVVKQSSSDKIDPDPITVE